jgi:DNA anti-recombination protein RmuC
VFPVSPTTLHAYLLVITLGLKGLQIEQHAQEVMAYCGQLGKDFERFRSDFEVVGKHISNAQSKYGEADRRLERLETRLERAADWQEAVEPQTVQELPRAVDAA